MLNILTTFREGIQTDEQGIGGDGPGIVGLGFIVKVGLFELGANVEGQTQFIASLTGGIILDQGENIMSTDKFAGLYNESIANFSDQHYQSGRFVVILGMVPDQQDDMHDGDEQLGQLYQILIFVHEIQEPFLECLQVLVVTIGFGSSGLNFLLQFGEWDGVGTLILVQKLGHLLDLVRLQLLMDRIQILGLVLPELQLNQRSRVGSLFQSRFRILLQNVLDLFSPSND
mmetsp:Transcript_9277/g.10102  ORF Transcript_9277/g.10102 Transcript_9277/m.10102 type:complete len:229 (+) Transcript_9277:1035-1721(+)